MNHLLLGTGDKTQLLLQAATPPFLLIDDGAISSAFLAHFEQTNHFDIENDSFNFLRAIDYHYARASADTIYSANPQGADTLTVRNGKRALTRALLASSRLDKLKTTDEEVLATVDDLLLSPVLKKVLCNPTNFSFKGNVVVTLDRAKIGDFDAFILASLIQGQHKGQIIVPDFGFYGRDFYTSLIRQNRLVAGLNYLDETTPKLQQALLTIQSKQFARPLIRKDAEQMIFYTPTPTGNAYNLM